jgi:hypothetical protein
LWDLTTVPSFEYVMLLGTTPASGQTAPAADLESAAVEQVAFLFQQRDELGLGLIRNWPHDGTFQMAISASAAAASECVESGRIGAGGLGSGPAKAS